MFEFIFDPSSTSDPYHRQGGASITAAHRPKRPHSAKLRSSSFVQRRGLPTGGGDFADEQRYREALQEVEEHQRQTQMRSSSTTALREAPLVPRDQRQQYQQQDRHHQQKQQQHRSFDPRGEFFSLAVARTHGSQMTDVRDFRQLQEMGPEAVAADARHGAALLQSQNQQQDSAVEEPNTLRQHRPSPSQRPKSAPTYQLRLKFGPNAVKDPPIYDKPPLIASNHHNQQKQQQKTQEAPVSSSAPPVLGVAAAVPTSPMEVRRSPTPPRDGEDDGEGTDQQQQGEKTGEELGSPSRGHDALHSIGFGIQAVLAAGVNAPFTDCHVPIALMTLLKGAERTKREFNERRRELEIHLAERDKFRPTHPPPKQRRKETSQKSDKEPTAAAASDDIDVGGGNEEAQKKPSTKKAEETAKDRAAASSSSSSLLKVAKLKRDNLNRTQVIPVCQDPTSWAANDVDRISQQRAARTAALHEAFEKTVGRRALNRPSRNVSTAAGFYLQMRGESVQGGRKKPNQTTPSSSALSARTATKNVMKETASAPNDDSSAGPAPPVADALAARRTPIVRPQSAKARVGGRSKVGGGASSAVPVKSNVSATAAAAA